MFLSLETLMSIIRSGLPIPMELINLVNSVIIFFILNNFTQMLNFRISDTVILTVLLFGFLSSYGSICSSMAFPPLTHSDHVVFSVSIDFPSYSQQDVLFHCMAYDCVLIETVLVIIWEMFHRMISLNSMLLLLLVNFASEFRLELMYISLIERIRLSLTHLHAFQQLLLLP